MAHEWVVLLRAVNLGPRNRVPMPELRALLTDAGYGSVRTYIASGNVLLTAPVADREELARAFEQLVAEAFDVATTAIVRSAGELASVVAAHPFGEDTSRSYVSFLADEPAPDGVARLAAADHGSDRVHVAGRDVFLQYPDGVQGSTLTAARLERLLDVQGTARNWRTVTTLAGLLRGA